MANKALEVDRVHVFELNNFTYQIRPINVFQQLRLTSKLAPMLLMLKEQEDKNLIKEKFAEFFPVFSNNMDENAVNDILKLALSTVFRKTKTTWLNIYKNEGLTFQDINLKDMLNILYEVLEANKLLDFFSVSQLTSENENEAELME